MYNISEQAPIIILLVLGTIIFRFIWLILDAVILKRKLSNEEIGFLIAVLIVAISIPYLIITIIKKIFKNIR